MTFTQLEVFAALARAGSFSRAAALLGITQSAVSHAMRALETELGVTLVRRDAPRQEAAGARGVASGTLRIGSFGSTVSLRLLPGLLAAYRRLHPQVEVQVEE